MARSDHLDPWSTSLFALACVLQACSTAADDCERNGKCVEGTFVAGGTGGAGGPGTIAGGCQDGAQCDDGNPCTDDACSSGGCEHTPMANGTLVTDSPCYACQDGVVAPTAGMLCEGNQVCDGAGTCVACSESVSCPSGYGCNSSGACIESLGAECVNDADCTALGTVCTNAQCCLVACPKCMRCNPVGFASCENVPANEYHADCRPEGGSACDGNGSCKNDIGQPCTSSSQCASGNCSGGLCAL